MQKFILTIICILIKSSIAANKVNVTCEFKVITGGLVYIEGPQYECILQSNFPYIQGEIDKILGEHAGDKSPAVTVLTIDDKNIFEIPNLSTDFTTLKYINILKSSLKTIKKENVAKFKGSLEHLVIRNSNIEIIEKDVFLDLTKLVTIDLRNNTIFYIDIGQFSSLGSLKNFLLEGNACKAQNEDIKNILVSDSSVTIAEFIQKISTSSCGTLDTDKIINLYQNSKITGDVDAYKAKENYNTLFDTLNLRNNEIEQLGNQLEKYGENITALNKNYQNSTLENEQLKRQIQELEVKASELESEAEKCMEVDGTCRYITDETNGYSCIAHNININAPGDEIKWTGQHTPSSTDRNVNALVIRYLNVKYMPNKVGNTFNKLKILILRDCGLKKLSKDDFVTLEELFEIQISGNEISSIDAGVFDELTLLKSLNLSENKIKVLPSKIFAMLRALVSLDLSKNSLTALKSDFLPSTNVIENFLGNSNQLAMVESAFVWRLRSAKLIDFSGNRCELKFDSKAGDQYISFYNAILKKC